MSMTLSTLSFARALSLLSPSLSRPSIYSLLFVELRLHWLDCFSSFFFLFVFLSGPFFDLRFFSLPSFFSFVCSFLLFFLGARAPRRDHIANHPSCNHRLSELVWCVCVFVRERKRLCVWINRGYRPRDAPVILHYFISFFCLSSPLLLALDQFHQYPTAYRHLQFGSFSPSFSLSLFSTYKHAHSFIRSELAITIRQHSHLFQLRFAALKGVLPPSPIVSRVLCELLQSI